VRSDYLIGCIKKTKYITRCSVKSSTIYKEQLILYIHLLLSKSTTFYATSLRCCEQDHLLIHYKFLFLFFRLINHIESHNRWPNFDNRYVSQLYFLYNNKSKLYKWCCLRKRNEIRSSSKIGRIEFCSFWKQKIHL
jgi:hypothetical protein